MKFLEGVNAVFGFRTIPTTVLLVLVYAAIFSTVLVTDELPDIPKNTQGLDLDQAYADLHIIAARPHPYNSHSNDLVHSYLLNRLDEIASHYPHVHVVEDRVSNASWVEGSSRGVYFEGTNLLVKIDGSDTNDDGGVLFSAHYDSVSTAPGATDDGMGVATLLNMVQYLAEWQPKRTAVFNINNGEEDGLNGAHVFLEHPWSKIPDTFLNLEGAGAGGRPMMFRATSIGPLFSFMNKNVPHPHSNVLSADAFARGVIRSGTDYSIYEQDGMEGLDLAFYKGRSKYHTKYDSVPGTVGGKKALWAMMEATRGAGVALMNEGVKDGEPAVYFDLFAAVLIVFRLRTLLTINIVLLAVGPVIVLLLVYSRYVAQRGHAPRYENGNVSESSWKRGWEGFKQLGWLKSLWRLAKFWLALIVGIGLQILLVVGYVNLNPFIIYSHPYLVLTSALALAYLTTVLTLNLPITARKALPEQQKLTIILQTYILTWLLLLASTIVVGKLQLGGVYWVTAWNAVAFLGSVLGLVEATSGAKGTTRTVAEGEDEGEGEAGSRYVSGIRYEVIESGDRLATAGADDREGVEVETEPTEITPLIQQHRSRSRSPSRDVETEEGGAVLWWFVQLLVVVPVPAILVFHHGLILMESLPQTLADGSSAVTVYAAASLVALLTILPLAPFSIKVHRSLTILVLLIFIASTVYTWLAFPFSQNDPLKIYFQQSVELGPLNNATGDHTVTALTGVRGYLDGHIIPQLPSTWGRDVQCGPDDSGLKSGLWTCTWQGGLHPLPGDGQQRDVSEIPIATLEPPLSSVTWLQVNATRLRPGSARISVTGTNTRSCRLYFDSNPITQYSVHGAPHKEMQPGYGIPAAGLSEVRLWSRSWEREFVVDVDWSLREGGELAGRVACEWTEYMSATAGAGGTGGRIPALEEVLMFLPKWAVVLKTTDGLVEAWGKFTV